MDPQDSGPQLRWEKNDIERMIGLPGSKHTGTNRFLTAIVGVILTVGFYLSVWPFSDSYFAQMFTERGAVPYVIVLFTSCCLAILFIKWRKLKLQARALQFGIVPEAADFVLSPLTADEIIRNLYVIADNPRRFVLLNRVERALSNLRNLGRVSDVDSILRSQADNDENYMESTYTGLRGLIWAIPVLGFIGTVLGLSAAVGGFGSVLAQGAELAELRGALQGVTGGLAVAFETTLIGLVAAVCIQLLLTALKGREEAFLDECSDYCHRHIVSRLRTMAVADDVDAGGAP